MFSQQVVFNIVGILASLLMIETLFSWTFRLKKYLKKKRN